MIPVLREQYNREFSKEKYEAFLKDLDAKHPGAIEFRVAETPIFVPGYFKKKILDACESIIDVIVDPGFKELTKNAIPEGVRVPGENDHSHFIAFDYGICINSAGEYEPQLIEMQGFPSLFAYEVLIDDVFRKHHEVPANFSCYLNGYNRETYIQLLKEIIVGDHDPANVVLLEIFPHRQKTKIDFYCTEDYLGVRPVCLTELIRDGRKIYYLRDGRKTEVRRIYNRVIFDELQQQPADVQEKGRIFFEDLDVEWCPHPNWFYRISKYTLPLIRHPYVPPTFYLDQVRQLPPDLENYVLKPLFSFAGQGVVIDLTQADIDQVNDPQNWILQRKVHYADVIKTPDVPAKAEIRMFYFWKDGHPRPVATNNLSRLSKGKMIGVRYNQDKEWVGGNFSYFEGP